MHSDQSYHYKLVRRAIEVIDAAPEPLSLDDLAAKMGMSAPHFQRVFSAWAGVSPKGYQQYLMLGHAKTLLRDHFTTLDTAHSIGLSGTSRLHDLFIKWEAMSPGAFASQGAGLTIHSAWFDSPFGQMIVMGTDRGICGLAFAGEMGAEAAEQDLKTRWPKATFVDGADHLRPWVQAAFDGVGDVQLHMIGTPLQIKVWEALLNIPSGQVSTYSQLTHRVGSPRAVRAVGTAVGRNPISFVIPCHRALRKSGALGGYHWGIPVKRAMLAYETIKA
ncbi:MAG: methylated-DNA--[protein]-cysteine S-methyltransferase, partial [Planktomarina sp.]